MPYKINGDEYMNSTEAARFVGMTVNLFRWHVHKGHITPAMRIERTPLFTKHQLSRFKGQRGRPVRSAQPHVD